MTRSGREIRRNVDLRCVSGQSLVLAVVIMTVLAISSAGVVAYMTSNENSFGRDRDANRALGVAESGAQQAIATITQWDSQLTRLRAPDSTGKLPDTPFSTDGGKGTFSALKTSASASGDPTDVWTVTATGTYGQVRRTVTLQVAATKSTLPPSPAYDYGLYVSGDGGGCTTLSGSLTIQANIWIGNDFCPGGSTTVTPSAPHTLTLYVGGAFRGGNNVNIGTGTSPLSHSTVFKGCYNGNQSVVCSNNLGQQKTQSGIFADGYDSQGQSPQDITVDPNAVYAGGDWRNPNCTTTSGYQTFVFEPNTARSNNPTNTVTLDQPKSYDCTVSGTSGGHIAYDASTKMLTVTGAIFIDGNLNIYNDIKYSAGSNGTIYVNGTIDSKSEVCGPPASTGGQNNTCTGGPWNPDPTTGGGKLEIVAMNVGSCPPNHSPSCDPAAQGWKVSGSGELDIYTFVVGQIASSGNGSSGNFKGPIIANAANLSGGGGLAYTGAPPDDAPGGSTTTSNWAVVPSTWRQLPN